MEKYYFQNCQKIVVFSKDKSKVLLCKRKGKADYDGVFSFIGGNMKKSDATILDGLKREKDEDVGSSFKIKIHPVYSINKLFTKKDGNQMILPHYFSVHEEGEIVLNEEYSEFKWVDLDQLDQFEPKIPGIPEVVKRLLKLESVIDEIEFRII